MPDRLAIEIPTPSGGWGPPWPNVAEIEAILPHTNWTLVGGLMVQLHAVRHDLGVVRPTSDVDIVVHVETTRGVASATATALERLGYVLTESIDPRQGTAHRFRRGISALDLVTDAGDVVDVLVADHAAPRVIEKLRGRTMVAIEGGTQALRRTVNARLRILDGRDTTVSVPNVFGALVLKAAAAVTDSRDPERHLTDAVTLLACLNDPYVAREQFTGSDSHRLHTLARVLAADPRPWRVLSDEPRAIARAALRILTAESA